MKVTLTVEDRGIDYTPILSFLHEQGHEAQWQPLARQTNDELLRVAGGSDAVIAGMESWNAAVLEQMKGKLKIIARYGIGYDTVDLAAARACGVVVTNTPGVLSQAVAELALAHYLCLSRGIAHYSRQLHEGSWGKPTMGHNIAGKTVGLLGFGDIGQRFAALLAPFGCEILAYDPNFHEKAGQRLKVRAAPIEKILPAADCISLHLPVTAQTEGMVNGALLAAMKPGALLINTSRGKIVDEKAVCAALRAGSLGGAALDVFQQEPLPQEHMFRGVPNLVLTPHIGSATVESFLDAGFCAAGEVCDCLGGKTPRYIVNR